MSRNSTLLVTAGLAVIFAGPVQAKQPTQFDDIVEAGKQFIAWLPSFLEPFEKLGALAERQHTNDQVKVARAKFVADLIAINKELFHLESDKRALKAALQRRPIDWPDVDRLANSANHSIYHLKFAFYDLIPQLRLDRRAGGVQVAQLLDQAYVKKGWIYDLKNVKRAERSAVAASLADKAGAAADILQKCQEALAQVIERLQQDNAA